MRAEARGQSSHGVGRLDTYVRRIRASLIHPNAIPTVVSELAAVAVLDANAGFGHVAGLRAMDLCIAKAGEYGIGAVAVRNSSHFGIASIFAERASAQGHIGVATSNGPARMAPVGARTAVLGTNPIAVAVPGPPQAVFTLDMATSVVALGKILASRDAGQPIPEGWAISADGAATTDAAAAAEGTVLPLGGPKGFGLALVLEVLGAVLSGANAGQDAGSMYQTWDRAEGLGHFFVAISVSAFRDFGEFEDALSALIRQVHLAEPIRPGERVFVPGEIEAERERRAHEDGIALTGDMRTALERAAASAGTALRA